jgi:hypothetical protein
VPISLANKKAINFGHLLREKGPVGESGRIDGGENSPRLADKCHSSRFSFAQYDVQFGHLARPTSPILSLYKHFVYGMACTVAPAVAAVKW